MSSSIIQLIVLLVVFVLPVFLFGRVFTKAGFSWAWGLIAVIPIGYILLVLILAFAEWPIFKKRDGIEKAAPTT